MLCLSYPPVCMALPRPVLAGEEGLLSLSLLVSFIYRTVCRQASPSPAPVLNALQFSPTNTPPPAHLHSLHHPLTHPPILHIITGVLLLLL